MSETGLLRRTVLKASAVGIGAVGLAGSVGATAVRGPAARRMNADVSPDVQTPELDLETVAAETEYGTLRAELAENSYVGLVGDGRAIGIAPLDEMGAGNTQMSDEAIIVYLYDREEFALMVGEVDYSGATTFEREDAGDFDATVELVMGEEFVIGSVTFDDEEATPFTAYAATGVGGVYWALGTDETNGTDEEPEISADWVVLPDERQWGCVCVMPPMMPESPCCQLRML